MCGLQLVLPGEAAEPWVILVLVVAKELLLSCQSSSCLFCVSPAELLALRLAQAVPGNQSCFGGLLLFEYHWDRREQQLLASAEPLGLAVPSPWGHLGPVWTVLLSLAQVTSGMLC